MSLPTFSRRTLALLSLASAAVLFVSVNVIASHVLRSSRIDLTASRIYTLSDGTARTLAQIQEPVTLRFYYSHRLGEEIPSYGIYSQRVRETLEEYAARAKGKIDLQLIDPEPFSAEEDRAVALGLQGVPLEQGGEKVYFGLAATNSTDDQELIPFFQPERERFLEYDLTKMIHAIARPKRTVIGLAASLPVEGDFAAAMQGGQPLRPYAIVNQLRQLYELRTITTEFDKVEPDVDVLLIIHPQGLSEKTLYAIDQFVLGGGRALVFVDPHSEIQQARPSPYAPPGGPVDSNLEPLFKAWGVELEPKMVVGDRQAARRVNIGTSGSPVPLEYVAWLQLKADALNKDEVVTADLDQINMASAGILKPTKDAKTTLTPLIQTSADSEEIPADKVEGMPDVQGLLDNFKPTGERYTLAARISGPAQTAFPDGPPKAKDEQKSSDAAATDATKTADPAKADDAAQLKEAKQPINVIVVSDTDMLNDRFWAQTQDFFGQQIVVPTASNGDFVANALEVLAGGNDLVSLRSRGTAARPFVVVDQIQRTAEAQYRASEKALEDKLKATEDKIKDLQQNKEGTVTLTAEQSQAIDNYKSDMLRTRQQLREVQRKLRQDIDHLKAELEFLDIALIPILVGIAAIVLGVVRINRRKRPTVHA